MTPPEYVDKDAAAIEQALATGIFTPFEKQYIAKNGQRVDILLGGALLEGTQDQYVCFTLDIAQRKKAEEALRQSEDQWRTLANAIPQLAWMAGADGGIYWYNQRWTDYTGTTLETAGGRGWEKLIHADYLDKVLESVQHSLKTGDPWEDTFPLQSKAGEWRWFLSRALPIRDSQGNIVRWFGTNTDITEQRETEAALEEARGAAEIANKRKSQALVTMSHEFRTPLNAIIGYSEMMLGGLATTPEKQKKYSTNIALSGRHLLDMINDVLDISKIEAGKLEMHPQYFELFPVVYEVLEIVKPIAEKKAVHLDFQMPPDLGGIEADLGRFKQILFNLLSNAIKFNQDHGQVDISLYKTEAEQWLICSVKDTGIGIPKDKMPYLFTEFYQVEGPSSGHEGTGLGLPITKRLLALHGGEIFVESREEHGSTFTFKLPVRFKATLTATPN